jgi:hypothetical protein
MRRSRRLTCCPWAILQSWAGHSEWIKGSVREILEIAIGKLIRRVLQRAPQVVCQSSPAEYFSYGNDVADLAKHERKCFEASARETQHL